MKKKIPWTLFKDMSSGGGTKEEPYELIFIEALEHEARLIFYNRFGHNPERVTCTCCGPDYSINESPSLEEASAYHRHCKFIECGRDKEGNWLEDGGGHYVEEPNEYGDYETLEEFKKRDDVLIIYDKDIKPKERKGDVPAQGYIWAD